jgi:diacylglycerol kinase
MLRCRAVIPGISKTTAPDESHEAVRAPPLHAKIGRSFYFAFAGLHYLFRTQRNARIHLALGAAACGLAGWLRISRMEWGLLVLAIAAVIILEGLNTAMEAVVDLASPDLHPLAKVAKDLAAGMVLVASVASVVIGLLILGPPLWGKFKPL